MNPTSQAPPSIATPDFYEYAWTAPESIRLDGRFVHITWPDGTTLQAFDLWLYENVVGLGTDPATREGLVDPAEHSEERRVVEAAIDSDGGVRLTFTTRTEPVRLHPGWLRHVADGQHSARAWIPAQQSWTAQTLPAPPDHDGPAVLEQGPALAAWLDDLTRYGLARLRNLPDDPDCGLQIGARIGAIRDTNFGRIWDVKADISLAGMADTNSTANTNLRLGPHTDLPTRETPPGFQFLHCMVNQTEGGFSTMTDGLAVVEELRANQPEHLEALTTLNWVFFNRGPGIDHRFSGPLVDLGGSGTPFTLRAFYPVRGFPDMDPDDMARAYEAMGEFSRIEADPTFQISYPFAAGDMICFDNRRILHGREAFSRGGQRHLRGIYIDHDEIYSATRVANRRAAALATPQPTASRPPEPPEPPGRPEQDLT